jgi:hypothetical protein
VGKGIFVVIVAVEVSGVLVTMTSLVAVLICDEVTVTVTTS